LLTTTSTEFWFVVVRSRIGAGMIDAAIMDGPSLGDKDEPSIGATDREGDLIVCRVFGSGLEEGASMVGSKVGSKVGAILGSTLGSKVGVIVGSILGSILSCLH